MDRTTTDFCQESAVAGTRLAPHVTSKAATDVAGLLSDHFASQVNINVVQLQQEYVAIISEPASIPCTLPGDKSGEPANEAQIITHEMIDTSAFEHESCVPC